MPYITKERREYIEPDQYGVPSPPDTAGELNYVVTSELTAYIRRKGQSYDTFNSVIGVLEAAKLELYRRMVTPYEVIKCSENGDVYF